MVCKQYRKRKTISKKIALIVTIAIFAVSAVSISISLFRIRTDEYEKCAKTAELASTKTALCLDGDLIDEQFRLGKSAPNYDKYQKKIEAISKSNSLIKYLYVYKVMESGVYVVFDVDMPSMAAREPGVRIQNDPDIYNRIDDFIRGGEVPMGNSNDEYGSLLTAYTPIYDSRGDTVAYACCDIETSNYNHGILVALLGDLGIMLLAFFIAILFLYKFVDKHITKPIQLILNHKRELMTIPIEQWLESDVWRNKIDVKTNDEFEDLYSEVIQMEENISQNVKKQLEIEMANREKTEFLSRMSHDMRTPMNGILGMTALSKDEQDINVLHDNIDKIYSSGKYLLGLINETLDYQKIESGQLTFVPEIISAKELLDSVNGIIEPMAKSKGVTYNVVVEQVAIMKYVKIDPLRIRQIFINVLYNAVKFTPAGGSITFSQSLVHRDKEFSTIKYTVADNGCGMSEDFVRNRLFKPFAQELRSELPQSEGTGLGLSIVKRLVELMDGTITVESTISKGTTFTIILDYPVINEIEVDNKQEEGNQRVEDTVAVLKAKRILLVEDNSLNAKIARKILEKAEVEVEIAANGQIGIDKVVNSSLNYYDVILMDLRMPVLGGIEATKYIRNLEREDAKNVPIIAVSANAYVSDVEECLDAGMNDHVAKPYNPNILYMTIAKYLNK